MFVTDPEGREITLSAEQAEELHAALGRAALLPDPSRAAMSAHTDDWHTAAACATAPDPDRFVGQRTASS